MPDIQSPDPGRKLQQRYNLIGATAAPFLSPELVPVVIVDDLSQEAPGVRFASAAAQESGAAGVNSQTRLTNPTSSGVLIEQIRLELSTINSDSWFMFQNGPTLSTGITSFFQDRRVSGSPIGEVTHGVDVGVVTNTVAGGRGSTTRAAIIIGFPNYVLEPGTRLHFFYSALNETMTFWWAWGERRL